MSGPTVAEFILERLHEWGVGRIYGYPGDGINGLLGAFHEVGDRVRFVQTRHEEIASFAACAHAKLTGEVGVCMATSGPGAIHLLNGLYDAKLDHQPVVAIVGQQARTALGADYQQEVDLTSLYKDVAPEFVVVCMVPAQARQLVDRAMRIAAATRSPTCIIVPNDVQESPYEEPARAHGSVFTSPGFHRPHPVPDATQLAAAADLINAGERSAILIGQGAIGAEAEVVELAERIGAGVAKALNGRAALPDDLPFVTGSIGLLGTKPSFSMMEGCDTLILIGTGFPYAEWLPPEGQARAVQIDIDPRRLGMRYPTEVGLTGDSAATLQALLPLLEEQRERRWQETIADDVERWWRILDERAHQSADPINPQLVFHELSARLPDRAILTADSGSATNCGPATCACAPGCRPRSRGPSRRCARRCPTRWPRSSPTPTARSSRSSGTARCRCSASTRSSTSPATTRSGATGSSSSASCTTTTSTRSRGSSGSCPATRSSTPRRCCPTSTSPATPACSAWAGSGSTGRRTSAPRGMRRSAPADPSCSTS
jgi:pyruvate dehydrogenase (quinone)